MRSRHFQCHRLLFLLVSLCWGSTTAVGQAFDASGQLRIASRRADSPGVVRGETLDGLHGAILRRDLRALSSTSCAAANCHGGPRPGTAQPHVVRGSEYPLWFENDPHAQSWTTLCGPESVSMMRRLGILGRQNEVVDRAGFDNCLSCHGSAATTHHSQRATPSAPPYPGPTTDRSRESWTSLSRSIQREGVGCSACHGPAERWIHRHYQATWSPSVAADRGFVPAADLFVRARMCASCHVGDGDRDMNHDIIAAGHPSLKFEMATFHAWLPKHWRDGEASDRTYFEAQLWLAGQIATTDAGLALLQSRASMKHEVSRWPELATFDCASCHHSLGLAATNRPAFRSEHAAAAHSAWNDQGLRWLIEYRVATGSATTEDQELIRALDQVVRLTESQPVPQAESVADAAGKARVALAEWLYGPPGSLERREFRSDRLGRLVAWAAGSPATFRTWESATQFYLAAVAARESWPGGWRGPLKKVSDLMRDGLRYPQRLDVSRYAWRDPSGPSLDRDSAANLGHELASSLGATRPHDRLAEPSSGDQNEVLRRRLDAMLREIEEKRRAEDRLPADAGIRGDEPRDKSPQPPRRPKTREELQEELRNRSRLPDGRATEGIRPE